MRKKVCLSLIASVACVVADAAAAQPDPHDCRIRFRHPNPDVHIGTAAGFPRELSTR